MSEFPDFFVDSSIITNPHLSGSLHNLIQGRDTYISIGRKRSTLEGELFDRAERQFYTNLCQTLGVDFRGIFLFSATDSLYFRNLSIRNRETVEPKIGHWDYIDCEFLERPPETESERIDEKYLKRLKLCGIQNSELIRKDGFCFVRGVNSDSDVRRLEHVAKRSRSIRFIKWWIGAKKPECVDYGSYDLSYAESSQGETKTTCNELIKLIKIGGRIIIANGTYGGKRYTIPLEEEYKERVKALLINPEGRFNMFERVQ